MSWSTGPNGGKKEHVITSNSGPEVVHFINLFGPQLKQKDVILLY
jgi:hypothetical protein